jgi:hypothetical protein
MSSNHAFILFVDNMDAIAVIDKDRIIAQQNLPENISDGIRC